MTMESARQGVERACLQMASGQSEVTLNGIPQDKKMLENNAPRTVTLLGSIKMPNGEVAAEGECEINTQHHAVINAHLVKGPTTKEQADFLRSLGACED